MTENPSPVTELLLAWGRGEGEAKERLLPLVYDDLRRRAAGYLRRERPGHTLQPTALVHEAYLRLVDQEKADWRNRAQFLGVASQMMRRILVDHARARLAGKRGGGAIMVTLTQEPAASGPDVDLAALDEALEELAALDSRQAKLIELRFFGGLSIEETGEVLDISPATVKRDWTAARAWLFKRLRP